MACCAWRVVGLWVVYLEENLRCIVAIVLKMSYSSKCTRVAEDMYVKQSAASSKGRRDSTLSGASQILVQIPTAFAWDIIQPRILKELTDKLTAKHRYH